MDYQDFSDPFNDQDSFLPAYEAPRRATTRSFISYKKPEKKPFRLLKLPFEAMEIVLHQMEKMDLLELSFTSKKAFQWIQLLRIFPEGYNIKYSALHKHIQILFSDGTKLKWKFLQSSVVAIELLDYRKVKHINYVCNRVNETMTAQTRNKSYEPIFMLRILEHFYALFPGFVLEFNVEIHLHDNEFLRKFVEEIGYVKNLTFQGGKNLQMIKYAVAKLAIGGKLEIMQQIDDMGNLEIHHIPEIVIHHADRLFVDTGLKRITSRFCYLRKTKINQHDICDFIDAFLNMETVSHGCGWWKFEFVAGTAINEVYNFLKLRGATKGEVDRDTVFSHYHGGKYEEIDCRFGMDLVRKDGLLLTVVEPNSYVKVLNIVVWHERFKVKKHMDKRIAEIPNFVKSIGERNRLKDRNYRRIMEAKRLKKELEDENSKMEMESLNLQAQRNETQKLREQIARLSNC